MEDTSYYRITHPIVERAITLYNQGKIDSVALCATIKVCHPFKYQYVIGWVTESVPEECVPDILMVEEKEIDDLIFSWFLKKNGILMLPALKCKQTSEVLTWDNALSHDSLYFNFNLEGTSHNPGENETPYEYEHGFITSKGKFLSRSEASKFAFKTKQWNREEPLYSRSAQQFSLRDIENGEVYNYYSSIGINLPKRSIPITRELVKLLLKGYEAEYKRTPNEYTLRDIAHIKEFLS